MHQWQKWLINSPMLIPMGLIRASTCAFSSLSIVIVIISVLPISIGSYANFLMHLQSTRLLAACKMSLQTLSRCWGNFSAALFMIFVFTILSESLVFCNFFILQLHSFPQKRDGQVCTPDCFYIFGSQFSKTYCKTTPRCFGNYIMYQEAKQRYIKLS